jgi:hypothetical protein
LTGCQADGTFVIVKVRFSIVGALAAVLVLMALFIAGVSVWALYVRDRADGSVSVPSPPHADDSVSGTATRFFTGIGRLRIPLPSPADASGTADAAAKDAAAKDAVLIITIAFPYNSADRSFAAELAARLAYFREETRAYFAGFSAGDPRFGAEEQIKAGLLERFNRALRLGKIDTLLFEEFLILQ